MHRSASSSLIALFLAASIVAPVAAVQPGGSGTETRTGVLDALYVETFRESPPPEERYQLRTASGPLDLVFGDENPEGLGGAVVRVTGQRVGRTLRVASSHSAADFRVEKKPVAQETAPVPPIDSSVAVSDTTTPTATLASYATASVVTKSLGVILINFKDNASQPFTRSAVQSAVSGSSTSVKAFFEEESKGAVSMSASVYGWYTLDVTSTTCDWTNWTTLGSNAAAAAGVNVSSFTNVMYIFPDTSSCGFAGVAYVNGGTSVVNGNISVQVMTHELGHNFGLAHANVLDCAVNGNPVWLASSGSCTTQAYADPFSTMGNNALRHDHASEIGELGWLASSQKVLGSPGNTYTIAPYFGSGPVKLVRIPRGDGTFFELEYRASYGNFDNFAVGSPVTTGATIRIGKGNASPTSSPQDTVLLDTTPATSSVTDSALTAGKSVADPVSKISFTTLSADPSGVTVRVKEGIAPSAPGSLTASADAGPAVSLGWTAATDNVAVASYRVARNGTTVATVASPATGWSDSGVAYGTTYTYSVAAIDTSGNASSAATASVTTPADPNPTQAPTPTPTPSPADPAPTPTPTPTDPPPAAPASADIVPPTAPAPLTGSATAGSVTLSWGASTDDTGVSVYQVTRNGVVAATLPASTIAWRDGSRRPSTTYSYSVRAFDAAGNGSTASSISVRTPADTIRPTVPKNVRVVSRSGAYVTFAWSPSRDNVKVWKYRIYRVGRSLSVGWTYGTKIRIYARYGAKYYIRAIDTSGNRSWASISIRGR